MRDKSIRVAVLERDGLLCAKCGKPGINPLDFDVDHIVPLSNGGSDTQENCQVLCVACHRRKGRTNDGPLARRTIDVRKTRDIGDVISLVREHQGLTQSELSAMLCYDRFYLSKIESGVHNLFATRLLKTFKQLGITMTLTFGQD